MGCDNILEFLKTYFETEGKTLKKVIELFRANRNGAQFLHGFLLVEKRGNELLQLRLGQGLVGLVEL